MTGNRRHAGQLLAFEQLERGAAAGRDPRDPVGDARLVHGAHRVAAADDREAVAVGDRLARPRTCRRRSAATRRRPSARSRTPCALPAIRSGELARASPARCRGRASPSGSASNGVTCGLRVGVERARRDDVRRAASPRTRTGSRARTSSAIFPPISTASARAPRFSSTPILSSTFAPPETITNGRSTSPSSARGARARRAAAARRRRAAAARRPRSTRARGAPSRTRRSRRGRSPSASSRANARDRSSSPPGRSACSRAPRPVVADAARRAARATGSIANFARSSSVFGRPRCEQTRTSRGAASSSSRSVGSEAAMRVSSATRPSSSGTFRSARTRTTFPRRRPSRPTAAVSQRASRDRRSTSRHE